MVLAKLIVPLTGYLIFCALPTITLGKLFDVQPITVETEQNITIYAAEIDVNQKSIPYDPSTNAPSQTDFAVFADIINITGPLVNRGRGIKLIGRKIVFNNTLRASIDTSGIDGHMKFPDLPVGGSGVSGGNGTDGGNVVVIAHEIQGAVTIKVAGGSGQSGQNGMNGKNGANGKEGIMTGCDLILLNKCARAPTDGEPGTDGGNAGNGGTGGKSGNVNVLVTLSKELGPLTLYGSGGTAGDAGIAGHGGRGGKAGYNPMCSYGSQPCKSAKNGRNGSNGKKGSQGSPGENGKLSINKKAVISGKTYPVNSPYAEFTLAEFEEYFSLVVLTSMLRSANSMYINLNIHTAAHDDILRVTSKYMAIMNLTDATTTASSKSSDDKQKAGINNEARSRLLQLTQGLDFFGNVYNYVPVLSLKEIEAFLSSNIPIASDIFTQLSAFESKEKTEKERVQALLDTLKQTKQKIQNYEDQLSQIHQQLIDLRDTINYLHTQIQHQTLVVSQAEEDVKNAIARLSRFDSFESFLGAIGTLIGIGTSLAGDIDGISELLNGVGDLSKVLDKTFSFKDFLKQTAQLFKKASATFGSIKDSYNKIKGFIEGDYPDKAKVYVEKEQLDALLSEFVGKLPAADELKAQMDLFLNLEQTRNKRILDFDSQVIESVKVQAQIGQLNASIQVIQAKLVGTQDPTTPLYVSFMQHAYQQISESLLQQLHAMHLAYNYWTLTDDPFCVPPIGEDGNIGFETAFVQLSNSIQQQQAGISQAPQHIENREVKITRKDHDFSNLDQSRQLTFSIPYNHSSFADVYQVAVTKVSVDYPGYVPTKGTISVGLKMMGDVAVKDSKGVVHYYAHRVRVAEYSYNYGEKKVTTDGNLSGDGYVGLSPFTTWNLDFTLPGNEFVNFQKINSIRLTFEGYAHTIAHGLFKPV